MKRHTLKDVLVRIENKTIRDLKTGCMVWQGTKTRDGNPIMNYQGRKHVVTRLLLNISDSSFDLENPLIQALHRCDNPSCVNIEHLYIGTRGEKMKDRWRRKPESFDNLLKIVKSENFRKTKEKMLRDKWENDPEFRRKQNEAREKTIIDPSYRKKLSEGLKKYYKNNPEVLKRRGGSVSKDIKKNTERIKKMMERDKGREFKKKVSEGRKRFLRNNPTAKKKLIEGRRNSWLKILENQKKNGRTCTTCKKVKPITEFPRRNKAKIIKYHSICLECKIKENLKYKPRKKLYNQKQKSRDQIMSQMRYRGKTPSERYTNVHRQKRKWIAILKEREMLECIDCGYNKCWSVLTYDHIDPSIKTMNPARLFCLDPYTNNIEKRKVRFADLDNLVCRCVNCHHIAEREKEAKNKYQ